MDEIDKKVLESVRQKDEAEFQGLSAEKYELSEQEKEMVAQDAELEKEYGDSEIQTAIESGVSGATFGFSDQALVKSGLMTEEELRERRLRNPNAALLGEVVGVAAPTLLSGGTSLAARTLSSGVRGAARA